jgi:hypothetical protein
MRARAAGPGGTRNGTDGLRFENGIGDAPRIAVRLFRASDIWLESRERPAQTWSTGDEPATRMTESPHLRFDFDCFFFWTQRYDFYLSIDKSKQKPRKAVPRVARVLTLC